MNPQDPMQPAPPQQPQQPPYDPQPPVTPPAAPFGAQPQQPFAGPLPVAPDSQPQYQTPAPTAPYDPQPPVASAPFGQPLAQPASQGASSKGKLIALIGGVVGLLALLAVGIFVLLPMLLGVSKQDYVTASDKMSAVKSAYDKIGGVYVSTSSTSTEIKNDLDTLKTARQDFNTKLADLGGTKAIKRDKDLKKLYGDVTTKKPDFDKAMDAMIEAYETILPTMTQIRDLGTSSSDVSTRIATAASKLEGISGLKDENNKTFVDKTVALLKKEATLARKVQQGRADYTKYDSQAVNDFYDTQTAISDATRDWQSNLTKLADNGELKDQLSAMDDKLFEKTLDKK